MYASDKLAACSVETRREYPWLYGLADAYGSFEITNLRVVWHRVAAIRDDLTLDLLKQAFEEYEKTGLLFTWQANGKRYAHWTKSEAGNRLPPDSRKNYEKRLAPDRPEDEYDKYLQSHHIQDPKQIDSVPEQNRSVPERKRSTALALALASDSALDSERGGGVGEPSARAAKPLSLPAFEGKILKVTKETDEALAKVAAYDWITDRSIEYAKADAWLIANPARRKKNYAAFIVNWFANTHKFRSKKNAEQRESQNQEALLRGLGPGREK